MSFKLCESCSGDGYPILKIARVLSVSAQFSYCPITAWLGAALL
jgi:hypothetical protein